MARSDVVNALRAGNSFCIVSHISPDGDSLGSQLAVQGMCARLGKRAVIASRDVPPPQYRFLAGISGIQGVDALSGTQFDCIIILDSSNPGRTGMAEMLPANVPVVNIDHHRDNTLFGSACWVVPQASSTAELLFDIYRELCPGGDRGIAEQIYTGIFSDTGGFRYSNTTASSLLFCAELVKQGVIPHRVSNMLYNNDSLQKVQLWARVLSEAKLLLNGFLCFLELPEELFAEYGSSPEETEGLSDEAMRIQGVEVGLLVRYFSDRTKFNLRSSGRVDVGAIAREFGGGGHAHAASCILKGVSRNEAYTKIFSLVEQAFIRARLIAPQENRSAAGVSAAR